MKLPQNAERLHGETKGMQDKIRGNYWPKSCIESTSMYTQLLFARTSSQKKR